MSWLANVDLIKVALVTLPFVLFFLDVIIKGALRLFPESAGADLCLVAVGVDASVLIECLAQGAKYGFLTNDFFIFFVIFLVGLALWIVCLRLVAPPLEQRLLLPGRSFIAFRHWLASLIGLGVSIGVIWLYMEV
jgi:hypothetical protein